MTPGLFAGKATSPPIELMCPLLGFAYSLHTGTQDESIFMNLYMIVYNPTLRFA